MIKNATAPLDESSHLIGFKTDPFAVDRTVQGLTGSFPPAPPSLLNRLVAIIFREVAKKDLIFRLFL